MSCCFIEASSEIGRKGKGGGGGGGGGIQHLQAKQQRTCQKVQQDYVISREITTVLKIAVDNVNGLNYVTRVSHVTTLLALYSCNRDFTKKKL